MKRALGPSRAVYTGKFKDSVKSNSLDPADYADVIETDALAHAKEMVKLGIRIIVLEALHKSGIRAILNALYVAVCGQGSTPASSLPVSLGARHANPRCLSGYGLIIRVNSWDVKSDLVFGAIGPNWVLPQDLEDPHNPHPATASQVYDAINILARAAAPVFSRAVRDLAIQKRDLVVQHDHQLNLATGRPAIMENLRKVNFDDGLTGSLFFNSYDNDRASGSFQFEIKKMSYYPFAVLPKSNQVVAQYERGEITFIDGAWNNGKWPGGLPASMSSAQAASPFTGSISGIEVPIDQPLEAIPTQVHVGHLANLGYNPWYANITAQVVAEVNHFNDISKLVAAKFVLHTKFYNTGLGDTHHAAALELVNDLAKQKVRLRFISSPPPYCAPTHTPLLGSLDPGELLFVNLTPLYPNSTMHLRMSLFRNQDKTDHHIRRVVNPNHQVFQYPRTQLDTDDQLGGNRGSVVECNTLSQLRPCKGSR